MSIDVLEAARSGDEAAFVRLTAPHRRVLHLHAYRLLGSLDDADDVVQETLLRAWRGLAGYDERGVMSAWLHRIATNVALRMIQRRPRQHAAGAAHLQPYPDRLLDEPPDPSPGPEDRAVLRETAGLAYIAALQLLPANQRAVLVLRDALGWSARDTAETLDMTVPATNSALQRARDRLSRECEAGTLAHRHTPASPAAEAAAIAEFLAAWDATDVGRIVALLTDDALLTMPPIDIRLQGPAQIGEFFATQPARGHLERIRHVAIRANGQPGLASYADEDDTGIHDAYGIMVFAIRGDRIAGITGFPRDADLFTRFGLALTYG
jgi:RNA polymerase sigma-70 factor (TIGR02960 family)